MTNRAAIAPSTMRETFLIADSVIESGNSAETLGDLDAAQARYVEATRIAPNYARGWLNLGIVLALKSELSQAIDAYDRALALEPTNAPAHYNRGLALSDAGDSKLAEMAFRAAIKHRSIFPDAYVALASAVEAQGRNGEAIHALTEALQQAPEHPGYLLNLGLMQQKAGNLDEAEVTLRKGCENDPAFGAARLALATVLREKRRLADACDMLEAIRKDDPAFIEACSSLLFTLLFRDDVEPQSVFEQHVEIGAIIQSRGPARFTSYGNVRSTSRRLRVGYVSGDFGRHAVAFFALPVIAGHDRQSFEVFCYSNTKVLDDVSERFRMASDVWRDISAADNATATQMVRDDEIDVLVDLSGHTGGNRLDIFGRKPSPIQVTWLGYLGTTGLKVMDYRLCDRHTDSPGASARWHTEALAILPASQWCYRPYLSPEPTAIPPISGNGFATFGSFNQFAKITRSIQRLWSTILCELPESRLLAVGIPDGEARNEFLSGFEKKGVNRNRIDIVGRVSIREYYKLLNDVDIALDTTPYSGATTTCDALWMSVPVITLAGAHSVARSGVSLLTTVGLPDLIAQSPQDYIRLATTLAQDVPRLTTLRHGLRERMRQSPLMDETKFVQGIEALYRHMWQAWCEDSSS